MATNFKAYNDAHSRAVFKMFEERLKPLMEQVAPDWLLHHMTIERCNVNYDFSEEVVVRLVIRPIGSARFVDPDGDLRTGPPRLPQY